MLYSVIFLFFFSLLAAEVWLFCTSNCQICMWAPRQLFKPTHQQRTARYYIFLSANEIHFICRGKYRLVPTTSTVLKCAKKIRNNPPVKADAAKTGSVTQACEKGPTTSRTNNLPQGKKSLPNPPTRWVKNY